jgi:aspartyl-tRNA(Asn)/glutamyl-tRNA(Gln) amidotransferase subunit A
MAPLSRRTFIVGAAATAATTVPARRVLARTGSAPRLPDPSTIDAGDPTALSLVECAALLRSGRLSSLELTTACLERARRFDGLITAWIRVYPEVAEQLARSADLRHARGDQNAPVVLGVPLALKDLYAVEGLPVTASSKVLDGNIATGDSGAWRRLKAAGMVLLGHSHTDEFAFGVGTPQTGNPWDPTRSPGGSSGGSGAALAARFVPAATGTDTGGSLRLPATACGTTSLKPSFGRVSAYGVIPLLWSRDHAGPMGRSAADCSLLLEAMAGPDQDDPSTLAAPPVPSRGYPTMPTRGARPLEGRRFGVVAGEADSLPAATAALYARFLDDVRALGATLVDVHLPPLPAGIVGVGALAEAGAYHQQFGPTALPKYRTEIGAVVAACIAAQGSAVADYIAFERDRVRFNHAYNALFAEQRLDCVVLPGTTIDGATRNQLAGTTIFSGSVGGNVVWANLTGAPALCTPVGRSSATGMPFGVQLGGLPHTDATILQLAVDYQAAHPYWRDAPTLAPAPRAIPTATPVTPPVHPFGDATGTDAKHLAYQIVPTLSTRMP